MFRVSRIHYRKGLLWCGQVCTLQYRLGIGPLGCYSESIYARGRHENFCYQNDKFLKLGAYPELSIPLRRGIGSRLVI
jgi:hypothetical protein